MTYRNPKLLELARGQKCMNCFAEDGTIVSAHSNASHHGKGKSIKAHDIFIAWLCFRCHQYYDEGAGPDPTGVWGPSREDKQEMWRRAHDRTMLNLVMERRLVVG
jgi:hypothetical protein